MRPGSNLPKRVLETKIREDRHHERTGRFVMCVIYTGRLASGVKSPGYLESITSDRRPAVYVVPRVAMEDRNIRKAVEEGIPADGHDAEADWARENVRLVHIDNNGLSREEIMKDFGVRVSFPFWTATFGVLVPRPGQSTSYASVPDGQTADDIARALLLDQDKKLIERMRLARARYGTPKRPVVGVPFSGTQEQFPNPGDKWT